MKKLIILLHICLLASTVCCAQSKSNELKSNNAVESISAKIHGKWKYVGKDTDYNDIIFKENGTCLMRIFWNHASKYDEITAKFSFTDEKIKITDDNGSNDLEYKLVGNKLTLKNYIHLEQNKKMIVKDAVYQKVE